MGEHVLAKLGSVLRDDLVINPRAQDLAPLHTVLPWAPLVRASHFARLFELEFFQPWLDVLYLWLVHPGYNGDEVAQWFEMFGPSARAIPGIEAGFGAGLKLMDEAMALGAAAPDRLRKPVFVPLPSKKSKSRTDTAKPKQTPPAARAHPVDITFRSIAEEFIAAHDLILVPLGKSHPTTGKPLFRVGKTMDKGVVVYIGQDAVFAQEEGSFRAVSLEDLVQRAR
jgi:tuftelin-interacting protein 11